MDFSVTLYFYSLKNRRQGKDNNRQKSPAASFQRHHCLSDLPLPHFP